jgi:hypothetical protein
MPNFIHSEQAMQRRSDSQMGTYLPPDKAGEVREFSHRPCPRTPPLLKGTPSGPHWVVLTSPCCPTAPQRTHCTLHVTPYTGPITTPLGAHVRLTVRPSDRAPTERHTFRVPLGRADVALLPCSTTTITLHVTRHTQAPILAP